MSRGSRAMRSGGEAEARRALRDQIARLEAELARRPPPPSEAQPERRRPPAGGTLLSADELVAVRDALLARLDDLDSVRAEVLRRLEELPAAAAPRAAAPDRRSRSTLSLAGARVRWVGA